MKNRTTLLSLFRANTGRSNSEHKTIYLISLFPYRDIWFNPGKGLTGINPVKERKRMRKTKEAFVEWLNELEIPLDDLKSNGGRIPDNAKYGSWLRRNDPIAFNVAFNEW